METIGRVGIVMTALLSLLLSAGCSEEQSETGLDHLKKARAADEAGQFPEAIREYTLAVESGTLPVVDHARAYNNRGIVYMKTGATDKAFADYTKAILLDPELAIAYYNRGGIYTKQGDFDKAIADYSTAIRLDPK